MNVRRGRGEGEGRGLPMATELINGYTLPYHSFNAYVLSSTRVSQGCSPFADMTLIFR